MVFPLMLAAAAIGAGGNLLGGILGGNAQREANETNFKIALLNYYQRENERYQALAEAHRQEREGKLGSTDAYGNRSYFVPGKGWVVELSPTMKEMQDLQIQEEGRQLTQDIPARREQMFKNLARQGREENVASGLMEAMLRNYRGTPDAVIGRRNRMSAEAITEGMDTALSEAMRQSLISGSSNSGRIAADIGREKSKQLRRAFMENQEGAMDAVDEKYFSEQGNLANLYNMFATRASAMPGAEYNPRNIAGPASDLLSAATSQGKASEGSLLNAFAKQGGTLDYTAQPEMGLATSISQAASSIAGNLNYYDSLQQQQQNPYGNYAYSNYFPPAPTGGTVHSSDYYKQNVGPW